MSTALPVITILRSVMTAQSYLRAASLTVLPPVITQNQQYAGLVTQFTDWQEDLWSQFWEGLVSAGIAAEGVEINALFQDGVTDEGVMNELMYSGVVPIVVTQTNDVANLIANGQGLLQQLEAIAKTIEDADQKQVDAYTALVAQLQTQFSQQEDTLTKDALDSATQVVSTAVEVMLAVGTEGDASQPLVKGVIKLGSQLIDELVLTDEINQTLSQLETAWQELDQASANLAQITQTCSQLTAVTDQAAATLTALGHLSTDWNTIATSTTVSSSDWTGGASAALQEWAAQMVKLTFGNATQTVSTAAAAATVRALAPASAGAT